MGSNNVATSPPQKGPVWDIALLFPEQGQWSEEEYVHFEHSGNRLIEFVDGSIEILPVPGLSHQQILMFLFGIFRGFLNRQGTGKLLIAPFPFRLKEGRFREPDLIYVDGRNRAWFGKNFATGADLIVEVVSQDRARDFETKRLEYAEAGVSEYWIVDPKNQTILVLTLQGNSYAVHGEFKAGQTADSKRLAGLIANVDEVFRAGDA